MVKLHSYTISMSVKTCQNHIICHINLWLLVFIIVMFLNQTWDYWLRWQTYFWDGYGMGKPPVSYQSCSEINIEYVALFSSLLYQHSGAGNSWQPGRGYMPWTCGEPWVWWMFWWKWRKRRSFAEATAMGSHDVPWGPMGMWYDVDMMWWSWCFGTWILFSFIFHFIYGMSSFPLTNSYFSEGYSRSTTNQWWSWCFGAETFRTYRTQERFLKFCLNFPVGRCFSFHWKAMYLYMTSPLKHAMCRLWSTEKLQCSLAISG